MAVAATQLGMSASSFLRATPFPSTKPAAPSATHVSSVCGSCIPMVIVNCQQGSSENHTIETTSRRCFAVAAGVAATVGVFGQPQAAEAKRNKPPPPEEKKAEVEDKSLSAYDARLLANARRREAMKESVEKMKAKASESVETAVESLS